MGNEQDLYIGPKNSALIEKDGFISLLKSIWESRIIIPKAAVISGNVDYAYPMGDHNAVRSYFMYSLEELEEEAEFAWERPPESLNELVIYSGTEITVRCLSEELDKIIESINSINNENIAVIFPALDESNALIKKIFGQTFSNGEIAFYYLHDPECINLSICSKNFDGNQICWNSFFTIQGKNIISPDTVAGSVIEETLSDIFGEVVAGANYS